MSYESPELNRLEDRFEEFDLWSYAKPLIKNVWAVSLIVVGCFLLGILYNLYATPIYKAKSSVIIRQGARTNLIRQNQLDQPNWISNKDFKTKLRTIKSAPVARILTERLIDRGYFKKMFETNDYADMAPKEKDEFLRIKINKSIQGGILVNNPEGTNILEISYTNSNPVLAKDLVNMLADIVVEFNLQEKMIVLKNSQSYLVQEIEVARKDMDEAEAKLYQYRLKYNIFESAYDKQLVATNRADLSRRLAALEEKHRELESKIEQLNELSHRRDYTKYSPVLPENQNLTKLNRDLFEAEVAYNLLLITYDVKHPDVIKGKKKIETFKQKFEQELVKAQTSLNFDLNVISSRIKLLEKNLAKLKDSAVTGTEKDIEYAVLDRDVKAMSDMYRTLLAAIKEIQINTNDVMNNVIYVHERATVPVKPIKPRKMLNLLASILLGLGLGVGFAFGKESIDQSIHTPEDVNKTVQLPVLSTVPLFSSSLSKGKSKISEKLDETELPLLVMNRPKSLFSEGITALRTHLNVKMPQDRPVTLLITSCAPREGKSVITSNLGLSFAIDGKKTLIVDADMHRPSIHKMFGEQRQRGLYEIIVETLNPPWSELNMDMMNFGDIRHLIRLKQWSGIVNVKWDSLPSPLAITFREGFPIGSNITSWQEKYKQPSGFPPPKDTMFSLNEFEITDLTNKENSGEQALDFIKQYPRLNESSYFTKKFFDHYIRKTGHKNLHLLTAGAHASNTNEVLGSSHIKIMLEILMESYDIILIDSPPSWPLSDVSLLSPYIDGVLWVCRAGEIPKPVFKKHVQQIQAVQPNILGVIINAVDLNRDRYYYSSYYYYNRYYKSKYYAEYYSEDLSESGGKDGKSVLPLPPS